MAIPQGGDETPPILRGNQPDGYIAGPNGEFDWIIMDPSIDFAAAMAEFDTYVMGRKTFEVAQQQPNLISGMISLSFRARCT